VIFVKFVVNLQKITFERSQKMQLTHFDENGKAIMVDVTEEK